MHFPISEAKGERRRDLPPLSPRLPIRALPVPPPRLPDAVDGAAASRFAQFSLAFKADVGEREERVEKRL